MSDAAFWTFVRLLPKGAFCRCVGATADARWPGGLRRMLLRRFVVHYQADETEAERPAADYPTLDAFFTRRLRAGARTIDPDPRAFVSPCDGAWGASGEMEGLELTQIKGTRYSAARLVGDEAFAARLAGGTFATFYLCPRDYHRVHFPLGGKVTGARLIPGRLWPVNPPAVRRVPELFAVNERLVVTMEAPAPLAVVMVGALGVSRIEPRFDADWSPARRTADERSYAPPRMVAKGDELGVFHLGSTVVVAAAPGSLRLDAKPAGTPLRLGERIGTMPAP